MKKGTRCILILLILLAIQMPVFATFEAWLGTGFVNHKTTLAPEERENFWVYYDSTTPDSPSKSTDHSIVKSVNFVGPSIDLSIFPYYEIPVGIKLSTQFLFPCGYNKSGGYRSYKADYKNRNMLAITYAQTYNSSFGLFADLGYEFDFYRIAKTNNKNQKEEPEYNRFTNQGIYGELGFLTTIEHGYFKFGVNYSHSIVNESSSMGLIFLGGMRF